MGAVVAAAAVAKVQISTLQRPLPPPLGKLQLANELLLLLLRSRKPTWGDDGGDEEVEEVGGFETNGHMSRG